MRKLIHKIKNIFKPNPDSSLRETLEELIEDDKGITPSLAPDEREMLANILKLRDLMATDVMIPRADIIAISLNSTLEEIKKTIKQHNVMRLPVYKESLDDVVGYIYIRDFLEIDEKNFKVSDYIHKIDFIAPSMRVLDLLIHMRSTGEKLALVVDEYGGVDGLLTLSDLVEEIVGDIQEVASEEKIQKLFQRSDGVIIADARMSLEELEKEVGNISLENDSKDNIETLGGLVFHLANRVPQRGELISQANGIIFEIIEVDPRRVKRVGIHRNNL